jgi:NADH-quinone oxidoreductase subunit H
VAYVRRRQLPFVSYRNSQLTQVLAEALGGNSKATIVCTVSPALGALAETKRTPFDLPEGESEIIGYFVEYSGMKFGMFFLADFLETIIVACLSTRLFLGGWQVPYLLPDGFHFPWGALLPMSQWAYVLIGVGSFSVKVLAFCWLFMQIRHH